MQLHYLLVVVVVNDISDVKVMSSTVAVILAITWVVTNYNIQSETCFLKQTKLIPNRIRVFFSKKNELNRMEIKTCIPHLPTIIKTTLSLETITS